MGVKTITFTWACTPTNLKNAGLPEVFLTFFLRLPGLFELRQTINFRTSFQLLLYKSRKRNQFRSSSTTNSKMDFIVMLFFKI